MSKRRRGLDQAMSLGVCFAGLVGCGGNAFTMFPSDAGDAASAAPDADAPSLDGGLDVQPPPASDAAPIGRVDAAGPGHFCATSPAMFCEDFDESSDLAGVLSSWTSYSTLGAALALDTSAGVPSPPNALEVSTTATSGAKTLLVQTMPPLVAMPKKMRLELDLRIDAASSVGPLSSAAFAAIAFGTTQEDGTVSLDIGSGPVLSAVYVAAADAGASYGAANASAPFPPTGQWSGRYALEIDFAEGAGGPTSACAQVYASGLPLLSPPRAAVQHAEAVDCFGGDRRLRGRRGEHGDRRAALRRRDVHGRVDARRCRPGGSPRCRVASVREVNG
jgi:hypothetical protein